MRQFDGFMVPAAATAVVTALLMLPTTAYAQPSYPNKPIRFITPYAPGGSTTVMARMIGQHLT